MSYGLAQYLRIKENSPTYYCAKSGLEKKKIVSDFHVIGIMQVSRTRRCNSANHDALYQVVRRGVMDYARSPARQQSSNCPKTREAAPCQDRL